MSAIIVQHAQYNYGIKLGFSPNQIPFSRTQNPGLQYSETWVQCSPHPIPGFSKSTLGYALNTT